MKERPILFSAPMVRAILDGRKTQTRRVVRPQPDEDGLARFSETTDPWRDTSGRAYRCPYGLSGGRLWIRETWAPAFARDDDAGGAGYLYRATNRGPEPLRWKSPIHMPRAASRLTLEVVAVRCQRLHEITEEDAAAEGVECRSALGARSESDRCAGGVRDFGFDATLVDHFSDAWEGLYGFGSWHENPWVWAITFRVREYPR